MASNETLAILGGRPVRERPMPPRNAVGKSEWKRVLEVMDYYAEQGRDPGYEGHFERLFTQRFVDFMGGEGYADAVSTGTISVYLALVALDLPVGSEVVVPAITDAGSIAPIIHAGLVPVLADTMPDNFNTGIEQVGDRLSERTSAIIVVHAAGRAVEVDAIRELAAERGLKILEDCSQAVGATFKGMRVGTYGDITACSTMFKKTVVSGSSGGIVYTRERELHRLALAHADRGKPRWRDDFDDLDPGTNLFPALNHNTDEVSCAIGLASLERIEDTLRRRRAYLAAVAGEISKTSRHCRPHVHSMEDSPFFLPVFVDTGSLSCSKVEFAKAVRAEGIDLNPHYKFLVREWRWLHPYLNSDFACPNATAARDRSFNLYLNENYGPEEALDVAAAIRKVEAHYSRAAA